MANFDKAEKYDCIAIGSGEAGKLVPWMLSGKKGQKCAVIERQWIGGSCPNIACLPSKTIIHSAATAYQTRKAHQHGVRSDGVKVDMTQVRARKREMVQNVRGFQDLFKAYKVEIIRGEGVFVAPKVIQVSNGRLITADNIIICTGSRSRVDSTIPGLVEAKPMIHIEALELDVVPDHLIIIGGGYIGLEFAQAFRRFGAEVTVIQRQAQVLPGEDKDVVDVITTALMREGVRFLTNTTVASVSGTNGDQITVTLASTDGSAASEPLKGSHILVSAGRIPNTANMGLEAAGVKTTGSGHVAVDSQLRTSVPGVYAAGDCANSPHFTHMGWDDHRVIYGSIVGTPRESGTVGRLVPRTLFTSPELARVGLTEREAQEKGIKYRLTKLPMGMFLRTQTLDPGDTEGYAKALVEADGDRILGFTAVGPNVGELLAVVTLAMKLGVSYREIEDLIVVHPTLNEGLVLLFAETPARVE
ncbi:Dihydrolipoyl dehydrogenase [Thozetella sp. PMI_491]|nr:Dihydrolipoyl dehydrogenase [Thozetella sp. PMI_491]